MKLKPCPDCGGELHYDKGFPGNQWEPPEPEQLYCEDCEWEPHQGLDNYLVDDRGNER